MLLINLKIKYLIVLLAVIFIIPRSYGQVGQNEENVAENLMVDSYTVIGTTVAGIVLGASTLSFVEEPSDHLKNIVVGGALGIIVGVGIVAYKTANKSKDMYIQNSFYNGPAFKTSDRVAWHKNSFNKNSKKPSINPTLIGHSFSF